MRRSVLAGALLVLILPTMQAIYTTPAHAAPICPSQPNYDESYGQWNTGSANGVRAPVQLRKTGTVCEGGFYAGENFDWIGIDSDTLIAQAGFGDYYDASTGVTKYCRFTAIGSGTPDFYGSCADAGGTYVYFQVYEYQNPTNHNYYFGVFDCGTSGYGSCTERKEQLAFYGDGRANGAETPFGKGCTQQIMGSPSNPVNIGTNVNPIEWQSSVGGSWGTKTLAAHYATCSHYKSAVTNTIVSAWDDRN